MTEEERAAAPCMVARCPCCNRIQLAIAGELTAQDRKQLMAAAEQGYVVSRILVSEARAAEWFCKKMAA